MVQERLDLVVFGATGYTGKYIVKEIVKVWKSRPTLKWGIAGRNEEKLLNVLNKQSKEDAFDVDKVEIIIADVGDVNQLAAMALRARVVLNSCGPFRFYGPAVVKACVENGANYVDIAGEPQFMEQMQLKYNKQAEEAGVYIVSACGLDSIPVDVGVSFLEKEFNGQVNSVETFLEVNFDEIQLKNPVLINYGTYESAVHNGADAVEIADTRRKLYPTRLPPLQPKLAVRSTPQKSSLLNKWCIPFPGADRAVVMRSQRYLHETERKRPVQINTYVVFPSLCTAILTCIALTIFSLLSMFSCGRRILLRFPRFFSLGTVSKEGPTAETVEKEKFSVTLVGKGWNDMIVEPLDSHTAPPNQEMVVRISGRNPAYTSTAIMIVCSALMILDESDRMPGKGGVIPPGAAFARTSICSAMHNAGISVEIISTPVLNEKFCHSYLSAFMVEKINGGIY